MLRLPRLACSMLGFGPRSMRYEPDLHEAALRIAGDGVLDLDHVGAPVGQHGARRGDEAVHGDLEDADARQRGRPFNLAHAITVAKVLRSMNSSSPATPISRPMPDCLYPPNGASGPK